MTFRETLRRQGYRPFGKPGVWAKPVGYSLLLYTEENQTITTLFKDLHGKISTWNSKALPEGGSFSDELAFYEAWSNYRLPNNGPNPDFGFLTPEESFDL